MSINGYENEQPGKLWAKDMNKQFTVNEIERVFKCAKRTTISEPQNLNI